MAFSLVAHTNLGAASGGTTTAIDTTGANLLVLFGGWYVGTTPDISISTDSKGNTFTALTKQTVPSSISARIWYVANPVVGSGHTFTWTGNSTFAAVEVQAWSGAATSTPFDVQNGAQAAAVTSLATGSVTPSQSNSLIVTNETNENNSGGAVSINASFTNGDQTAYSNGVNEGGMCAYLLQGAAAAVNPTWSITNSADMAVAIAVFKPAAVVSDTQEWYPRQAAMQGPRISNVMY